MGSGFVSSGIDTTAYVKKSSNAAGMYSKTSLDSVILSEDAVSA